MATAAARLSPSSYAVLGIVALRGPSTPYDIKRALGRLAGEFWSVPHTQCYGAAERLAAAGLLSVRQEEGGRRRRTYTLTEAGRRALRAWLGQPTPGSMEIRDVAQLKLFCGELGTRADLVELARGQAARYRQRLADLDEMVERLADRPELALRIAPARLGRRVYQAALEFWLELAAGAAPPGAPPARPGAHRRGTGRRAAGAPRG